MNKLTLVFILFSLILGVGCQAEQTAVSPIPIIAATETGVGTAVSTPTRPATATATPLSTATKTAVPTSTIPATTTATPLPPPEGQIIFLWDSKSPSSYGSEPKQSLYRAEPGKSPSEWHIQPILNDLYGLPVTALSPDQSKLALMVLEDRMNDGDVSHGSFQRGGDAPNLYIYSLTDGSFERITDDYPNSYYLEWTPDSQEITFPDDLKVFSYNVTTEIRQLLSDNYPDKVAQAAWSPVGNPLAVKLYSGPLYFFNQETGENVQAPDELANSPHGTIAWSPDGTWLASNIRIGAGLFVINPETLESIDLVTTEFASSFVWSPDGKRLAYAQTEFSGNTVVNSPIHLWNVTTRESQIIQEFKKTTGLLWSPDSETLAVGALDHDSAELTLIESNTKNSYILLEEQTEASFVPLTWSPDGTWLLFFKKQAENTGLYVIHRDGGEPYLLLNTTETGEPYAVSWLPRTNSPSAEGVDE